MPYVTPGYWECGYAEGDSCADLCNGRRVVLTVGGVDIAFTLPNSGCEYPWLVSTSNLLLAARAGHLQGIGAADAASPVAQTLQAQGSRSGTDTNTGGAVLTVRAGAGTGTGTLSTLDLSSPIAVASGTGAQTQTRGWRIHNGTAVSTGYTVATLPASPQTGARAHVTDATTPTYLGALTGGGAVVCPVFYNGSAWVSC